jgi:hypothetical protein
MKTKRKITACVVTLITIFAVAGCESNRNQGGLGNDQMYGSDAYEGSRVNPRNPDTVGPYAPYESKPSQPPESH